MRPTIDTVHARDATSATSATERICRRCLYTTAHPLGLVLDDEGICSGCRVHEEKDRLDWAARWRKLEDVVAPYRSRNRNTYDCIVPVSGAGDSHFIVHVVKERLKLKPLLVTYNKYFNTPLGIRNLANLRIRFDSDILIQNVNPQSVKKITRTTLREIGSVYWPCIAGQTVFPVQTSVRYRIPLIIWGAHQGLEQVGMFSHEHEVQMTRRYRKEHDLMGREAEDLLTIFDTLREEDLWQYRYPDDRALSDNGVVGIYLGNYVRWDPKAQHEQMIRDRGFRSAAFGRTFDCYDYVDCFTYLDVHDQLKLFKHGYSKVTDHATREIRHGRLSRAQALELVRKHEQVPPAYSQLLFEWLGVKPHSFQFQLDQHRNPKFWQSESHGRWTFVGRSTREPAATATTATTGIAHSTACTFTATEPAADDRAAPEYITVGKGYP